MADSPFLIDLKALLSKHFLDTPNFAYGVNNESGKILYSGPYFNIEETSAAIDTFLNGKWAVNGEKVFQFEKAFSKYVGQKESVMVNSGSSANLLMIAAAKKFYGWKNDDVIICSPVGFPTTISAITLNKLSIAFADIELNTLNFDLDKVEEVLKWNGTSAKAIFVSPVLGNPPDIDRLVKLAKKYKVKLLLDGCDSLGSKWNGKHLNSYFEATSCSFYPAHHITTLQGGMISSNNLELIKIARSMSNWGRACYCRGAAGLAPNGVCGKRFSSWLKDCSDCIVDHKYVYDEMGYNLQALDLQGAIGLVQLSKIEQIHSLRKKNYQAIAKLFANKTDVSIAVSHKKSDVSWFGVPITCPDQCYKTKLVAHLEKNQIQTRNYFAGNILLHPAYKNLGFFDRFPNSNEVLRRIFFVGCAPFYTDENINRISDVLTSFTNV